MSTKRANEQLKDILIQSGMKQKEIARLLNAPEKTISEIMTGKQRLTPYYARKLSTVLVFDPAEMLALQARQQLADFDAAHPEIGESLMIKNDEAPRYTPCDACGHEIKADRPHWHRATYQERAFPTINQRNLCERCYPIAEEMLKTADVEWFLDGFELCKPEAGECNKTGD